MVGRSKKVYIPLYRDVYIETEAKQRLLFATIQLLCPICQSALVGTFGTRKRKNGRVEYFQCKNPNCSFLENHKQGKQFQLTSSYKFKTEIWNCLTDLYGDLIKDGAKHRSVAKKYHVSESLISQLRSDLEDAIESYSGLDQLVDVPQPDRAIAIDETFLKIARKSVYIIIATGYKTHKTLGLKVSKTRKEKDMREVFDEAEKNTKKRINFISADAWGATQAMVKNLCRKITLLIHKHKKPYDKAVIRHFTYTDTERITTDIGVKTDVFTKKKRKEYYYKVIKKLINKPPSKPVGRPKGVKNGQGKKKKKSTKKKKRGRKGLFAVFTRGKRGYMDVNPYRKTLKVSKGCLGTVRTGLNRAFEIYCRKSIQNNIAENINSVLQSLIRLRGPKSIDSVERRLRATIIVRNTPEILQEIHIKRNLHGSFLLKQFNIPSISRIIGDGWKLTGLEKKGACVNC